MIEVNKFLEELKNKEFSVIKFSAEWCNPCRAMKPDFEEVKSTNPEINFVDLDIDEESDLTVHFKIRSIPALIYFNYDNEVIRTTGLQSRNAIQEKINELTNKF